MSCPRISATAAIAMGGRPSSSPDVFQQRVDIPLDVWSPLVGVVIVWHPSGRVSTAELDYVLVPYNEARALQDIEVYVENETLHVEMHGPQCIDADTIRACVSTAAADASP